MKRYPLWYGIGGVVVVALAGFILYDNGHTPSVAKAATAVNTTLHDEDVELTVSTFVSQLVEGNVKEAESYTTGDSLKVLRSNEKQKVSGTLLDKNIQICSLHPQYAQVDVDVSVQTKAGKDRNHYLYSLMKVEKQWKIFKIEQEPLLYTSGNESNPTESMTNVITKYLGEVSKANWKGSLGYLSGNAFQEVEKTFTFLPKHLQTQIKIINQKPMVVEKDKALILVDYEITNEVQKKIPVSTLFQLESISGDWKISDITNVAGGKG